jgi:hypothetical protein
MVEALGSRPTDGAKHGNERNGAGRRREDLPQEVRGLKTQQTDQGSADESAEDADDQVADESESAPFDELAGEPACAETDDKS